MAKVLFSNNARSKLAFAISETETVISLEDASNFPELLAGTGKWFSVTLENFTVGQEIVRCTLREGNLLHITRSQEGTTAKSFPAGTLVENRITAGALKESLQAGIPDASQVPYDNQVSALDAVTAQEAIDVLADRMGSAAEAVTEDLSDIREGIAAITQLVRPALTLEDKLITTSVPRFSPEFWRIDGPRSASFCITPYQNGFEAFFIARRQNDLVGVIWDSLNFKDHKYTGYWGSKDYSGCVWEFDVELSSSLPTLSQEDLAPALTVEVRTSPETVTSYFIALKNYATEPESRASKITIDWDTVKAGFAADIVFDVTQIEKVFFGLVPTGFNEVMTTPHTAPIEGFFRLTNSVVTGPNALMQGASLALPPHKLGMSTSYDDHYDLNPKRIVNNMLKLGYVNGVNHYVGMSTYPNRIWNEGQVRFVVPAPTDGHPLVNLATKKWHEAFLKELAAQGIDCVLSVSFEMFSEFAQMDWCQKDWNDALGYTGYTPPSYFISPCNTTGMEYLRGVFGEFAQMMDAAEVAIKLQVGEPWWWVNPDGKPCVYDYSTRVAFNTATELYMTDMGTTQTENSGPVYEAMISFLQQALGDACKSVRTFIKGDYPEAEVTVLIFIPTILSEYNGYMRTVNLPINEYKYPNFDFIMTEVYDWMFIGDLDRSYLGAELAIRQLKYPSDKVEFLAGFVPNAALAPVYGLEGDFAPTIWRNIFGNIKNNMRYGLAKQYIWAYPQVMESSLTILDQLDEEFFYLGDSFYRADRLGQAVLDENSPTPLPIKPPRNDIIFPPPNYWN